MDFNITINQDSSNWESESFYSLGNEMNRKRNHECSNLQQFKMISSCLTSRYNGMKESTSSLDVPPKIQISSSNRKYLSEEIEMRKTIGILEEKLKTSLLRNQFTTDLVSSLKKEREVTAEALHIAKDYYSSVWNMAINIEDSTEHSFTCIVNFNFADDRYPLKFVIDRNSQEVSEWDGSSLLTPKEEDEIKERFCGVPNYLPQVLSELRLLALNKSKQL